MMTSGPLAITLGPTLDGLPLATGDAIGVVTLLVLLYLMLATSRLYTKGQVDRMQAAHDAEITRMEASHAAEVARMEAAHLREVEDERHDKGEWRTEARLNQQTVVELGEQNRTLVREIGDTITDFLASIRRGVSDNEGDT